MAEDAGSHTRDPASALGSSFTFDSSRGSHFPWEAIQLAPDLGLLVGDLELRQALARGGNVSWFCCLVFGFSPGVSSRMNVPNLKQLLASTMHSILFVKFISWLFKYRKKKLERKIPSSRGTKLKGVCGSL